MGNLNFSRIFNYFECGNVINNKLCSGTNNNMYISYEYIEGNTWIFIFILSKYYYL